MHAYMHACMYTYIHTKYEKKIENMNNAHQFQCDHMDSFSQIGKNISKLAGILRDVP